MMSDKLDVDVQINTLLNKADEEATQERDSVLNESLSISDLEDKDNEVDEHLKAQFK